jgi:hypothetical protein
MDPHPGPRIDKIPIRGWIGLVITIGVLAGFAIEVPPVRWFLALSVALGLLMVMLLRLSRRT